MSVQKGNSSRSRSQKYKNKTAFKNNLHDTSHRTKFINNIQVKDVCEHCKSIIDWKIKYKKYKPLTQPKTCVKCNQKTIKQAYHNMCSECCKKYGQCAKCCTLKEVIEVQPDEKEQLKLDTELKQLLQSLPERKRRTFLRYMNKKQEVKEEKVSKQDLVTKLNSLKVEDDSLDFVSSDEEDFENDSDIDDEED